MKFTKYQNNLITHQISLPLFVIHQKEKRHQYKGDINLKNTCIKDLKIHETILKLMNPYTHLTHTNK